MPLQSMLVRSRKNLKELVDIGGVDPKSDRSLGRKFWRWLHRQHWRKVLPMPREWLGERKKIIVTLRVELLLVDQLRVEPEYIGKWHLFLPSDVLPG